MGRPIKKKFFGSLTTPYQNHSTGGKTGVGGEGVASVTVSNTGTAVYSQGATVTFGAPNIAGGIQATGTPAVVSPVVGAQPGSSGRIPSITITNAGSGYTATVSISVTTATGVTSATTGTSGATQVYPATTAGIYVGMQVFGANISASSTFVTSIASNVVNLSWPNAGTVSASVLFRDVGAGFASSAVNLTSNRQDAITIVSYLSTASQSRSGGDIMKQESSRRYLVQNSDGKGICHLTTGTLTKGTMHIIGTDFGGATYYVTKLTAHKATVANRTSTSTAYLSTGKVAKWTLGAATGTGASTVISLAHTI
jgi:hypothetical protein